MSQQFEVYDPPDESSSDYVLQFKIKNGPLLRAMRMRGHKSIKQFCEAYDLPYGSIARYFALTLAPMNKKGNWSQTVLKLSHVLHLPPESLFPEQHLDRALKRASGELSFTADDVRALLMPPAPDDPETALINQQTTTSLRDLVLRKLNPKEYRIVSARFGLDDGRPLGLQEVGDQLGVSRSRILQIENKALRKLKHPGVAKQLEALTGLHEAPSLWERKKAPPPKTHYVPHWKLDAERNERKEILRRQKADIYEARKRRAWVARERGARVLADSETVDDLKREIVQVLTESPPGTPWSIAALMRATDCKDRDLMDQCCAALMDEGRLRARSPT